MSRKSGESADETTLTRTSEAGLRRLSTNLEATERALARSEDRYVRFFREHEKFFRWVISRYYPLEPELLTEYSDEWNWRSVSRNENIDWSAKLIRQFEDKLDWGDLSTNESLPWSKSFISQHEQQWAWWYLSANEARPWDDELILNHLDRWKWSGLNSLWKNDGIRWTRALIEKVVAYSKEHGNTVWVVGQELARNGSIDWTPVLTEWLFQKTEVHMHPPAGKILGLLSSPDKLGFNLELFAKLYDASRRDWSMRRARHEVKTDPDLWKTLSYNPGLDWTRDLIETHEHRWFWRQLSLNPSLPWTIELIEDYRSRWDWGWHGLSRNPALPWSEELIERYSKRWNWFWLSRNPGLPWSKSFIERYEDQLNWDGLSENEALPWSKDFIATYEDRWDWQGDKDGGTELDDDTGAVRTELDGAEKRRGTKGLTDNQALPWSIDLLEQYSGRWGKMHEDTLRVIWLNELEHRVDDETVKTVLRCVE